VRNASNPDGEIEIVFTGLRPGEKLYEELLIGNNPEATSHPRILTANEEFLPLAGLEKQLERLRARLNEQDVIAVRAIVAELVPEYVPADCVVDWVHLETERTTEPARVARHQESAETS